MTTKQIDDHEYSKFTTDKDNNSVVRVIPSGGTGINALATYMEMTETSTTIETYEYYESSSKATLYNTIVVTYTDTNKTSVASVEWS